MATKKMSRIARLKKKQEELKSKGSGGNIVFLKPGTVRARLLPVDEEADFVVEVTQFYLGAEIKGVFSPSTFGEPCAIMEKYESLRDSDDQDDKQLAKTFIPKKKFLTAAIIFSDDKGRTVDAQKGVCLIQLTNGLYQEIIELYLDEDEAGDMTDPSSGYDLKLIRVGSTMTDTEYSVRACKPTKLLKEYNKEINVEALVKDNIPSYDETKSKIKQFIGADDDDDDEEEEPKRKKKRPLKKKKRRSDDV